MNSKILTPSYLSASIDILVTVVFIVTAYIANLKPEISSLSQALYYFHDRFSTSYNQLASKLAQNRFIDDLPLLLFWIVVGIAVYLLTIEVVRSIKNTVQLAGDINNSNTARKESLLKETGVRAVIRITTVLIWYIYLRLFILRFIPLYLSDVHSFSSDNNLSNSIRLALMTIAFLLLLHVNTVVFRLIALRKRLFTSFDN
ncbi:MAG: hypothetical protein WDN66_01600 [Candidatus Saccharibacteria bacterium]